MLITDAMIQQLAERQDVRHIAAALEIPATEVAKDLLRPLSPVQVYDTIRCADSMVCCLNHTLPVWVVTWQCRAIPKIHDVFTYLRICMSLN